MARRSLMLAQWTADEWIDEAIEQYDAVRTHLARWQRSDGSLRDYQEAASATQRATAAAAIATAKISREMRNSG